MSARSCLIFWSEREREERERQKGTSFLSLKSCDFLEIREEREMGGCVSTPKSCVGGRVRSSKRRKNRTRRKIHKKRAVSSSRLSDGSHLPSFTNPTFQGPSLSLLILFLISRFIINSASWAYASLSCLSQRLNL